MPALRGWSRGWGYRTGERWLAPEDVSRAQKTYFREALSHRLLSPDEEKTLGRRALKGDEQAQHTLVTHNLKLVVPIARRYAVLGVRLMDLLQEGNIGLMEAAKRYDPRRGTRFSTYATWWVRHHIKRALVDRLQRQIRLPTHTVEALNKVNTASERLLRKGIQPTVASVAKKLNWKRAKVNELMKLALRASSFNEPRYGEGYESGYAGKNLEEFIPSRAASPEEELLTEKTKWQVRRLLPRLPRDHEAVIRARYLIPYRRSNEGTLEHAVNLLIRESEKEPTHREIGERVGPFLSGGRQLTRERIRQLEEEALDKMRKKAA